jgi:nucleoside-diphosphate-sugar epimerase
VHIRDISRATLALLAAPLDDIRGEAFNIGTNEQNYRIRELAEIVRGRLPQCDVEFAEGAASDARSYRVDFSKFADRFPDCELEWTAERGADELASAYEAIGLEAHELRGQRFLRLGRLRLLLEEGRLGDALRWREAV